MTVLVWDGNTFAADKQATVSGTVIKVTKIKKIGDSLIGATGDFDVAQSLFRWFENGRKPEEWPEVQKDKDRWTTMIEITKDKKILRYEREPYPFEVEEEFYAFGSGMDAALGALEMGADSIKAVEITCKFMSCCGLGIDILRFE